MDGKHALRACFLTVVAWTVASGAHSSPARAEEKGTQPGVRLGVWELRVRPEPRPTEQISTKLRSKAYAFRLVTRQAWSGAQFRCLDSLWTKESDWNHRARNATSGAYGIPQALPGHKMGRAGRDWRFNPLTQIRWGLRYIRERYGEPCAAWGHFQSHNWY